MSNDLVVQLGAKLDQFSSDMNQAGDIADSAISRIESSFASLNPGIGIGGLAGVATGAVAGFAALLTALQSVNSELASISKNAEYVGVTVQRFQQIQFAATQGGVGAEQTVTDLRNVAGLLADAKQNENSLTKLLDANNIAYKDRNGTIVSTNQLLTIAGDLINRFSSMPEKTKAAQALGLSEQWVQALHNGSAAFNAVADSADAAGTVIDKSTVAKAEAFDKAWKQSSATLASQFKAVSGDIASYLDDLIDKAAAMAAGLAAVSGAAVGSGQEKFNAVADALELVRKDAQGLPQDIDQVTRVIDRMVASGKGEPEIILSLQAIRANAQLARDMLLQVEQAESKVQFPGSVPTPAARPASANDPAADAAVLAKRRQEANDAYDRAQETVTKHTAKMDADSRSVGEGASKLEELRAEAILTTAALQAGIPVTGAVADKIQDLAQDAGDAAEKLAKAKVAGDIMFGSRTALLSQGDVAIANQLKGIYGNDIAAALDSDAAAALRFQSAAKGVASSVENDLVGGLADITTGTKTVKDGFASLATSIISDIEKMIIKIAIVGPLMQALQTGASSLGLGSLFGGSSASALPLPGSASFIGPVVAATGGLIRGPGSSTSDSVPARLSNGEFVVNAASTSQHRALLDAINNGSIQGYSDGGPVGMPAIPNLTGSQRGRDPAITINNYSDAKPSVGKAPNGDISITIKKMVDDAVGDSLVNGSGRRVLGSQFGVKPFMGQ